MKPRSESEMIEGLRETGLQIAESIFGPDVSKARASVERLKRQRPKTSKAFSDPGTPQQMRKSRPLWRKDVR